MLERLGIDECGGVIPRFGLMYASAVRSCQKCTSAHACTKWIDVASSNSIAPDFCPIADIFFELVLEGPSVPPAAATHF
jgi:hypothetical protein